MTRSQRLKSVTDIADNRQLQAARQLSAARERLKAQEERLKELFQYSGDYQQRLTKNDIEAGQLMDFHGFLAKLSDAIAYQQQRVAEFRSQVGTLEKMWLALRQKADALDKAVTRARDQEWHAQESIEQKASDERTQRTNGKGFSDT
jgi:flagellar export protein FliJ